MQFDTSFIVKEMLLAFWSAFAWLFGTWYTWAFVLVLAVLRLGPQIYEHHRLRKAGMPEIDRMTGLEFEKYLEILFARMGYQVERTRYVGDQGGDLILSRGGERTLVQAKRHSKPIGNKAVQEAFTACTYYKCKHAMVVANQEFTRPAVDLAKSTGVQLWGRRELAARVLAIQATHAAEQVGSTPIAPSRASSRTGHESSSSSSAPTCDRCGRNMVVRQSDRGKFWGCSGFPRCRNIVPFK